MFGIDANTDAHQFQLFLNNRHILDFSNPLTSSEKPWYLTGIDGSRLDFNPVLIDKYGDPMGYAILTVPAGTVINGQPQIIKIIGESAESRSWYMTFESGVEESVTAVQIPALLKGDKGNYLQILVRMVHLGKESQGTIDIPGLSSGTVPFHLKTGYNEIPVSLPGNTKPGQYSVHISVTGKSVQEVPVTIKAIEKFTVYLVQHTHTDIGYTRPQTEILPDHLRYIDYALDFCDQTDTMPDAARFRWTCETSWAVREFLKTRPTEQVERLRRRVSEGRIELAGLFLNGSDLSDETMVAAMLEPVNYIRQQGFPVRAAMQSDINGVPWCLADYLPVSGIKRLNMAQNTHRARKPFDRPTLFWWESPSGNRLLVNRPEHYMWGNTLGILSRIETFETSLFRHLGDLKEKGYPYDRYAIQFSGYLIDNSPPSVTACRMVAEWNRKYEWPRLQLATISEFPDFISANYSDSLPVVRGAWPDWWMDGFGSAALQTAYARKAHSDYLVNQGLMSMASVMGCGDNKEITALQEQITDDLAFYDEHTFGAAESITDPFCENSVVQLGQKESYVWSAVKKNRILREYIMGRIQPKLPRSGMPTVAVFNPIGLNRNGSMMIYIDHQLLPRDRKFSLLDPSGRSLPMQPVESREEGTWWMANPGHVPPLGYALFYIHAGNEPREINHPGEISEIVENEYYRLHFDLKSGEIKDIVDKSWGRSLVDPGAPHKTGEIIYERLGKNRAQLEQYRLDEVTRTSWSRKRFAGITTGPVFDALKWKGRIESCAEGWITCEIRLYHKEKKLEFCYSMKKLPVTDPEAVYVAFPFLLSDSKFIVQVAGGTMVPGVDQIEGSSSDWIGIQDFVSLQNDSGHIVFVSPEIPLIHPGGINLGRFARKAIPAHGYIYSWVYNNYWTTNFLAKQEGELRWNYIITSDRGGKLEKATTFGMQNRVPMVARVLPEGKPAQEPTLYRSFYPNVHPAITMVSCKPEGKSQSLILHFRETAGKTDSIPIHDVLLSTDPLATSLMASSVSEISATGELLQELWSKNTAIPMGNGRTYLKFKPYEPKFIKVERSQ
jgi:hypothetical protein